MEKIVAFCDLYSFRGDYDHSAVIYNSESGKWSVNAMFDFGKFKWTNGNGNTSSFKMNTVGFGAQYHF